MTIYIYIQQLMLRGHNERIRTMAIERGVDLRDEMDIRMILVNGVYWGERESNLYIYILYNRHSCSSRGYCVLSRARAKTGNWVKAADAKVMLEYARCWSIFLVISIDICRVIYPRI